MRLKYVLHFSQYIAILKNIIFFNDFAQKILKAFCARNNKILRMIQPLSLIK